MRLELAWGNMRRWYLKTFCPGYVANMAGLRRGDKNVCPFEVLDPRDVKFYRNLGGYYWEPHDDPFAWRDRLGFARAGLTELWLITGGFFAASALLNGVLVLLPANSAAWQNVSTSTVAMGALRLVHSGDVRLMALLKAMSSRPAEILGLPGGNLRPGAPADVIVIDLDAPWVVDREELKSKCKNSPFDEARLQGRVLRTIVAGRTVFEFV